MSSIIINIPDCAKLGSSDPGERDTGKHDTITVYTEDCPATPHVEGPPPLVEWWVWVLGALLIGAFILATGIVRYKVHEERASVQRARIANPPKQCPTCGDKLEMERS